MGVNDGAISWSYVLLKLLFSLPGISEPASPEDITLVPNLKATFLALYCKLIKGRFVAVLILAKRFAR